MGGYYKRFGHHPDYALLGSIALLIIAGFIFLSSASFDIGKLRYDSPYYFLSHQFLNGVLPGVALFLVGYLTYYRKWKRIALLLFGVNLALLALVFSPLGISSHGSSRWLGVGSFSFQPSELLKITFVLYLASMLSSTSGKSLQKRQWTMYGVFIVVSGVVGGLIFNQPATTMAVIILLSGALIYFFSGDTWKIKQIILSGIIGIIIVAGLAMITPYRLDRIVPAWNSVVDRWAPQLHIDRVVDTYHLDQSVTSIGTGGVWGVGFGKSTSKYSILPEPMGDSIFAVIAEEVGFVGGVVIIMLYLVVFWRASLLMSRNNDEFARLIALGFGSIIIIQAFIHIGANIGRIPFTGIPLPLISYGGTALAVTMFMAGVLGNISRHTPLHR